MAIKKKRFVVRKYIMARSASEALKKERKIRPDDCFLDEKFEEKNVVDCIGFEYKSEQPDYIEED